MTAAPSSPVPAGTLRDELMAVLPHEDWCHFDMDCCGCTCDLTREAWVDALLPAVARVVAEARADELEQAAHFLDDNARRARSEAEQLARSGKCAAAYILASRAERLRAAVRQTDERNDR